MIDYYALRDYKTYFFNKNFIKKFRMQIIKIIKK